MLFEGWHLSIHEAIEDRTVNAVSSLRWLQAIPVVTHCCRTVATKVVAMPRVVATPSGENDASVAADCCAPAAPVGMRGKQPVISAAPAIPIRQQRRNLLGKTARGLASGRSHEWDHSAVEAAVHAEVLLIDREHVAAA